MDVVLLANVGDNYVYVHAKRRVAVHYVHILVRAERTTRIEDIINVCEQTWNMVEPLSCVVRGMVLPPDLELKRTSHIREHTGGEDVLECTIQPSSEVADFPEIEVASDSTSSCYGALFAGHLIDNLNPEDVITLTSPWNLPPHKSRVCATGCSAWSDSPQMGDFLSVQLAARRTVTIARLMQYCRNGEGFVGDVAYINQNVVEQQKTIGFYRRFFDVRDFDNVLYVIISNKKTSERHPTNNPKRTGPSDGDPASREEGCSPWACGVRHRKPASMSSFSRFVNAVDGILRALNGSPSGETSVPFRFTEECDLNILSKFLDPILNVFYGAMESKFKEFQETGRRLVLENVITEIASLADKIERKFAPYYEKFMPYLKFIAQNIHQKEFRLLRGKAIECISLIGMCVPREKFFQDANEVMQMLLKTQTGEEEVASDDVSYSYYINAWGRICRILGREFAVYLPMVMGPVMTAAEQKAEISVIDEDDMEARQAHGSLTYMKLASDIQNHGIKSGELDEKADALNTLGVFADELKEEFAGYLEPAIELMLDSLNCFVHAGCRQNASAVIPRLLEVARVARNQEPRYMHNMWGLIYPKLMQSIRDDPDPVTLGDKLRCLADSVDVVGPEGLTEEELDDVFKALKTNLEEYFTRADERMKAKHDEDYDEQMQENLDGDAKKDYYLVARISDVMHQLFKVYGKALCLRFETFLSILMELTAPNRTWQEMMLAVSAFNSLLRYSGEMAAIYKDLYVPVLKTGLRHPEGPVRQAAAFGWGLMAQHAGDAVINNCVEIVPVLLESINHPDARNEDNEGLTENCISTIVHFLKYRPRILESYGNLDLVLMHFLQWLPVYVDPDETPIIYDYFAELIEQNNPVLLGQNFANLPRIIQIIAEALDKDAMKEDGGGQANAVYNRLVTIVRNVQEDANVFQNIVSKLTPEQQEALSKALHQPLRKVEPVP